MAADVPRRLPPSQDERLMVLADGEAGGSLRGNTRWGRRIRHTDAAPIPVTGIQVVTHGDDGSLARPLAAWVIWVGAATPANAADYDGWYTANVID